MDRNFREQLIQIAKEQIPNHDASHDFDHALRVLLNAEMIAQKENGNFDIITPAALFHDLVVLPKDHPETHLSQTKSADAAAQILQTLNILSEDNIENIKTCIRQCSFSKGIIPELLESKILQDADGLESTGAISIMRTFSSTGQMKRPFYNPQDPFCIHREPDAKKFALDLFYERLLKVADKMHTPTAKEIAKRRTDFLKLFLDEFRRELEGK